MLEKKIYYQVGQIWQTRMGHNIEVSNVVMGCMQASDGFWYGTHGECQSLPERDLIWQIEFSTAKEPVIAACTSAAVGDINSQAKGSGARYNAGKPPFDLVPLQLMAEYYASVENTEASTPYDPILALSHLGEFQGGGNVEYLIALLIHLGDGWEDCAKVFAYGREKYAAWNWSKGMAWSVPIACAARHLQAMILGEMIDIDKVVNGTLVKGSTLPHRGHVFCNIAMLVTFNDTFPEGDDRPPKGSLMIREEDGHGLNNLEPVL